MRFVGDLLKRPGGRVVAGVGAAGALVVIVALVALGVYVYGGNGATTNGAGSSATATLAPTLAPAKGQTVFTIDPSTSSASFEIHEVLFGSPNTVVGKTNHVTGRSSSIPATHRRASLAR